MNPHESQSPTIRLTACYVDECLEQGRPEMERLKGAMARSIKDTLNHGSSEAEVSAALHLFVARRTRNPWKLAELVVEAAQEETAAAQDKPSVRRQAQEWIERNGWPTGARFIHGTHSGSYVYDPLGLERLPMGYADWPHQRPSFDDICIALASR